MVFNEARPVGHDEQHIELISQPVHWFMRKAIHVLDVLADDEHVVALGF